MKTINNIKLSQNLDKKVYFEMDGISKELNNWQDFRADGKLLPFDFKVKVLTVDIEGVYEEETKNGKTKSKFKVKAIVFKGLKYSRHTIAIVSEPISLWDETTMAKAPYNFVELNKTVITSDFRENDFSVYKGLSGYIEVEIETKTPVFIRGKEEYFFSVGDKVAIPGSSFRGLIRTMVEMMSYGEMSIYNNDRYFYRALAGNSSLDTMYKNYFVNEVRNAQTYKIHAGWIKKRGDNYYLFPSIEKAIPGTVIITQWYRVNGRHSGNSFTTNSGISVNKNTFQEVYFNNNTIRPQKIKRFGTREVTLEYKEVTQLSNELTQTCTERAYLVSTGPLMRKHYEWIINAASEQEIDVTELVKNYKKDTFSEENLEWFKSTIGSELIPCFYLKGNEGIISIGRTGYHRLFYQKQVKDRINQPIPEGEDFATSIFGDIDAKKSGKVYFEDLKLINDLSEYELSHQIPKILSEPKPTSFQLYLKQTDIRQKKHWDSPGAEIRGFKNYWHRITSPVSSNPYSWVAKEEDINVAMNPKPIKAIKTSAIFKGRIRFDNLTNQELGALLCALNLPDGCCHKIGMSKPLGLGSIKVKAVPTLIDREKRYTRLFNDNHWFEPNATQEDYKTQFENHIISCLKGKPDLDNAKSFWELSRMRQLKAMLTFDENKQSKSKWLDKTRYFEIERPSQNPNQNPINEFSDRKVLPEPEKVL